MSKCFENKEFVVANYFALDEIIINLLQDKSVSLEKNNFYPDTTNVDSLINITKELETGSSSETKQEIDICKKLIINYINEYKHHVH